MADLLNHAPVFEVCFALATLSYHIIIIHDISKIAQQPIRITILKHSQSKAGWQKILYCSHTSNEKTKQNKKQHEAD